MNIYIYIILLFIFLQCNGIPLYDISCRLEDMFLNLSSIEYLQYELMGNPSAV